MNTPTVLRELRLRRGKRDTIEYSDAIPGDARNHNWEVRFDLTDGYVGISQRDNGVTTDRILLSPSQVRELLRFVQARRLSGTPKREPPESSGVR